jgi:hypothetical protein
VWFVADAANEDVAFAAAPVTGSAPIAALNSSHPRNIKLIATSRSCSPEGGPLSWKVTVSYAIPTLTGGGGGSGDPDPLQRPIRISWGESEMTAPIDRDINNKPIVNSAGDPFDPPESRTIKVKRLTIRRFEPFFDLAKAETYEDTINSNEFVAGSGPAAVTFYPYTVLCASIIATGEYEPTSQFVEMAYSFDIIRGLYNNKIRLRPYSVYKTDQGTRGWYSDSGIKLGELFYADGTKVTQDVPLNNGVPIDTTIKVTEQLKAPVAPPNAYFSGKYEQFSTATMKVMRFDLKRAVDFTGLNL